MSAEPRVVIVGAGPAGLAAAASYRDRGGTGPVTLIGDDPDPPYRRPPLSKEYLRGEAGADELPLREPDFYRERGIELITGVRVDRIEPGSRRVVAADGAAITYDSCVLATGAKPAVPDIPVPEGAGLQTLRTRADSERLRTIGRRHVLIVGSGFIGCEAAASLAIRGAAVTLATAEALPQAARLGSEVGERIASWLEGYGVRLRTSAPLIRIDCSGQPRAEVGDDWVVPDRILLALGIEPRAELARAAGIELSDGRIPVDERMRTAVDGVLAAGDVALARNAAAGRALAVEHWGEALRHGEVAGATMAGADDEIWDSAPGFWSTIGERRLKYVAWGDGYDEVRFEESGDGGFTATYIGGGRIVGVLAHDDDEAYEAGRKLVEAGARP